MPPAKQSLELFVRGRTHLTESSVSAGGRTYSMVHPASADALFTEEEFSKDERIPYWADLWPSAISLARRVPKLDVSGKRVVELGCGIGLPSTVALDCGADVLATDYYTEALDFAAYNATLNTGRELATAFFDWNEPETNPPGTFDIILAADVLYERRMVSVMADLVPGLLAKGGQMVLADPARPGGSFFIEEMQERGYTLSSEETSVEQEGRKVPVMVYSLTVG